MKKIILLIGVSMFSMSCFDANKTEKNQATKEVKINALYGSKIHPENQTIIDSINCGLNFKPSPNYDHTKKDILTARTRLSKQYQSAPSKAEKDIVLDQAMAYFTTALLNNLVPHWYGTEWDFNGHTNIPNQGEVACGYFVSTTLKHMGVNLNRYKLAQQASMLEVQSIAISKKNVKYAPEKTIEDTLTKLLDGLYIVGLDNHVGYVYKHNGLSYFLHSSYITDRVMIELTEYSEAFPSAVYYLAPVANASFIKKWLLNEAIFIKTS